MEDEILDSAEVHVALDIKTARRQALPKWINFFSWIFLVAGIMVPFTIIAAIADKPISLGFMGIHATSVFTVFGAIITGMFALSATVAYGLLWGKDWAVNLGFIVATLQIIIGVFSNYLVATTPSNDHSYRVEWIFSIAFIFGLLKIKDKWKAIDIANAVTATSQTQIDGMQ